MRTLRGPHLRAESVAYSPDGDRLATGDSDAVEVWDPGTGAKVRTISSEVTWMGESAWGRNV